MISLIFSVSSYLIKKLDLIKWWVILAAPSAQSLLGISPTIDNKYSRVPENSFSLEGVPFNFSGIFSQRS